MQLPPQRFLAVGAVAVALVGAGVVKSGDSYDVRVALPSATNVVVGGPVLVNGFTAGKVGSVEVENGQAVLALELDHDFAPLHEGAQVVVAWKAVLSERQVEIIDGPSENVAIADGGVVPGEMPRPTEIDDVLNALDEPTRAKLTGFIENLDATLEGHEQDANDTLAASGPALRELGQLLQAMGTDGPAIRNLVTRMNDMLSVVAQRESSVQAVVSDLSSLTRQVAGERAGLSATLQRLPGTLDQATTTLGRVPAAVDQAEPLLRDLGPATAALGPVAANLRPVLRDLRPTAADLRPALAQLAELLGITPGLLDDTHGFLPQLGTTVKKSQQPLAFMRPYTPEMTAMLTNWGSAFSNYDSNGNFARIFFQQGPSSLDVNPGIVQPGVVNDPYPAPGAIVGQPWTDANGSELR